MPDVHNKRDMHIFPLYYLTFLYYQNNNVDSAEGQIIFIASYFARVNRTLILCQSPSSEAPVALEFVVERTKDTTIHSLY